MDGQWHGAQGTEILYIFLFIGIFIYICGCGNASDLTQSDLILYSYGALLFDTLVRRNGMVVLCVCLLMFCFVCFVFV